MNNKVGEHITLDFHGVHENHKAEFYEKIFKKIVKNYVQYQRNSQLENNI